MKQTMFFIFAQLLADKLSISNLVENENVNRSEFETVIANNDPSDLLAIGTSHDKFPQAASDIFQAQITAEEEAADTGNPISVSIDIDKLIDALKAVEVEDKGPLKEGLSGMLLTPFSNAKAITKRDEISEVVVVTSIRATGSKTARGTSSLIVVEYIDTKGRSQQLTLAQNYITKIMETSGEKVFGTTSVDSNGLPVLKADHKVFMTLYHWAVKGKDSDGESAHTYSISEKRDPKGFSRALKQLKDSGLTETQLANFIKVVNRQGAEDRLIFGHYAQGGERFNRLSGAGDEAAEIYTKRLDSYLKAQAKRDEVDQIGEAEDDRIERLIGRLAAKDPEFKKLSYSQQYLHAASMITGNGADAMVKMSFGK